MTEQEARATIKRISDVAIQLAICRHGLVKDEGDEDGIISSEEVEHIKSDILDCLTGDETGCLDESELSAENCELLFLQEKFGGFQFEPSGIYIASRASVPERGAMWRKFRDGGIRITSSWIDEDGEGETASLAELWQRIRAEIARSNRVVLYAEADDFPLKGALIEVGIALGMGKPIIVCLPGVLLDERNYRPLGSWIKHPLVRRIDDIATALGELK